MGFSLQTMKQISEVEEKRSRRLYISGQKPAGGRSNASSLIPNLFSSLSVNISFKDDVTVILLLGVSFMIQTYNPSTIQTTIQRSSIHLAIHCSINFLENLRLYVKPQADCAETVQYQTHLANHSGVTILRPLESLKSKQSTCRD